MIPYPVRSLGWDSMSNFFHSQLPNMYQIAPNGRQGTSADHWSKKMLMYGKIRTEELSRESPSRAASIANV